eukprot:TRINITY_DN3642_c2_g1_i2.p1 TRINITY_DN3642_c2_g1~~TRINITY_DN3642_c2_g1_i2.p1  ORF type:complete len:769 (-),score=238.26 TRINITY_DN3642_c2_g1_i2:51-2357(-)
MPTTAAMMTTATTTTTGTMEMMTMDTTMTMATMGIIMTTMMTMGIMEMMTMTTTMMIMGTMGIIMTTMMTMTMTTMMTMTMTTMMTMTMTTMMTMAMGMMTITTTITTTTTKPLSLDKAVNILLEPTSFLSDLQHSLLDPQHRQIFLQSQGFNKLFSYLLVCDSVVFQKIFEILYVFIGDKEILAKLFIESNHLSQLMDLLLKYPPSASQIARPQNQAVVPGSPILTDPPVGSSSDASVGFISVWEMVYSFLVKLGFLVKEFKMDDFDHRRVMEAFEYYQRQANEGMAFKDLITGLKLENKDSYLLAIIKLVNYLLEGESDVAKRKQLRKQFSQLGLEQFIIQLLGSDNRNYYLLKEVELFLRCSVNDHMENPIYDELTKQFLETQNKTKSLQENSDCLSTIMKKMVILTQDKEKYQHLAKLNILSKSSLLLDSPVPIEFLKNINFSELLQSFSSKDDKEEELKECTQAFKTEIESLKRKLEDPQEECAQTSKRQKRGSLGAMPSCSSAPSLPSMANIPSMTSSLSLSSMPSTSCAPSLSSSAPPSTSMPPASSSAPSLSSSAPPSTSMPPASSSAPSLSSSAPACLSLPPPAVPQWKINQLNREKEAKEKREREKQIKRQKINEIITKEDSQPLSTPDVPTVNEVPNERTVQLLNEIEEMTSKNLYLKEKLRKKEMECEERNKKLNELENEFPDLSDAATNAEIKQIQQQKKQIQEERKLLMEETTEVSLQKQIQQQKKQIQEERKLLMEETTEVSLQKQILQDTKM